MLAGPTDRLPFDVIATASIHVRRTPAARDGWEGRSHSLWYADAHNAGECQWFETAFMAYALLGQPQVVPFALTAADGAEVLGGGAGRLQIAWPFEAIDRDDPWDFVDRWVGWLAGAASGTLRRPNTLPERPAHNSWRR